MYHSALVKASMYYVLARRPFPLIYVHGHSWLTEYKMKVKTRKLFAHYEMSKIKVYYKYV